MSWEMKNLSEELKELYRKYSPGRRRRETQKRNQK